LPACKNCGTDNAADAIYCEDCGAQLTSASQNDNQPKIPQIGTVVRWNDLELTLTELLESGPINRYLATNDQTTHLVYISQDHANLEQQLAFVDRIKEQAATQDSQLLSPTWGDPLDGWTVAVCPLPEAQRLSQFVAANGPLSEDQVDRLTRSLLGLINPVHAAEFVIASLQPNRLWLNEAQHLWLDIVDRTGSADHWEKRNNGELTPLAVAAGFSPPELYGLGQVCTSSDLFSVAAILYFCITGETPNFESREQFFVANPVVTSERPALGYIINKSLQKFHADRFENCSAMLAALDQPVPEQTASLTAAPRPTPHFSTTTSPAPVKTNGASTGFSVPAYGPHSSPRTKFRIATRSHVGCVRSINQDACLELNFWFFEKSQPRHAQLLAVIDGMGGEAEGDKAASIALRSIAQEVIGACMTLRDGRQTAPLVGSEPGEKFPLILARALEAANRNIFEYACLNEERKGMGCTISSCIVVENQAYFAHVGDTRGYHFRVSAADHPRLEQVTTDHSLVGRLVAMGSLTPEEARHSPQRSIIFRAMGTNPEVEVDTYHRSLENGDRILLCSDGVWEYFEAGELSSLFESCPTPECVCQKLVDICLERGADDNATLAVLEYTG
jgi:serine/threonine protein phosphatase PrpC